MNNRLVSILALGLALIGCSKEQAMVEAPATEGVTLTISASFDQTKLSYTENEDGTYTAKFTSADRIQAYFLAANGAVVGHKTIAIDEETISHDGRKAKFVVTNLALPEGVAGIQAYLDMDGSYLTFAEDGKVSVNLASQPAFGDTRKGQVIYGALNLADAKTNTPGSIAAEIKFAYKTSLVKFVLNVPEGKPTTAAAVAFSGEGLHNSLEVVAGAATETATVGTIATKVSAADTLKAVAYATVWAGDNLAGTKVMLTFDDVDYGCDLDLKKTQLEAGKAYTVTRDLKALPRATSVWVNDEAGTVAFKAGGDEEVSADWLTAKNGVVSFTANETGKPRTARLAFANGSSFELTQIAPADFKGEWNFTTKTFATASLHPAVSAADPATYPVVFGEPRNAEELTAADGKKHTNNIGITGIYGSAVLDACVEIDYAACKASLGVFLDTRDGVGQEYEGGFVTFFPGLCTFTETAWGKPWLYSETEQGSTDYSWLWFEISADGNTAMYENTKSKLQVLSQYKDSSMNVICGFGVVYSATNVFNNTTVTGYSNFFQVNPKGYKGEFFERK